MSNLPVRNRMLCSLSEEALASLGSLELVHLDLREQVEFADHPIEFAYFPDDCLLSLVLEREPDGIIEVGMIGFEGVSGLSAVHGDNQSPFDAIVQGEGYARRVPVTALQLAVETNHEVRFVLQRLAQAFTIQIASTAFANGKAKLEARLARWLLMTSDRLGTNFAITHELLGIMLAVRRSGVTVAIQGLEGRGLIRATRGAMTILDRDGLIEFANGAYGLAEREYERLVTGRTN